MQGSDTLNYYYGIPSLTVPEYDTLVGGAGRDTFVIGNNRGNLNMGPGYAVIADFTSFVDRIQVKRSGVSITLKKQNMVGGVASDTLIYNGTSWVPSSSSSSASFGNSSISGSMSFSRSSAPTPAANIGKIYYDTTTNKIGRSNV